MSANKILLLVLGFPITIYLACGKLSLAIADFFGHLSARLWNFAFADSQDYKGGLQSNLLLVLGFPICAPLLCLIALVSVAISLTCAVLRYPQRKSRRFGKKPRTETSETVIHLAVQVYYIFRYLVIGIFEGLDELLPLNKPADPRKKISDESVAATEPLDLTKPVEPEPIEPEPIQLSLPEPGIETKIELRSERQIDYRRLQEFLEDGEWEYADQETEDILLEIADRRAYYWLDVRSVERLPCLDLLTIDKLWVHYSKGRFGFSVQQRIYEEVKWDYTQLCDRLGWSVSGEWLRSKHITYSLQAPVGHLPWISWQVVGYSFLAKRFAICNSR